MGTLISFSQPAVGQPVSLANPSSTFKPVDPAGLIPSQPIDLGLSLTAPSQNVDLLTQVASGLGISLDTLTQPINAQQNSAIGDMQNMAQMDPNVGYVLNSQGIFMPVDLSQQASTVQYAVGTATSTSAGVMPAGDGIARDTRKGEGQDGQAQFQSISSLPEESRFRVGTQEYRNARERRLLPFVREGEKVDSDASGQLGIDMLYSPPASRRVGRGPGMRQTSSSTATGKYAAAQQPAIPNVSGNAPMPLPVRLI